MINIDGIDLLGFEHGVSGWHIDPEAGFKIGSGADEVQWIEHKYGAVPMRDPRKAPIETEIPLIYIAEDDDEILSAVGELAEKASDIAASAPTGGTEITWQKVGATYPSTLDCLWLDVGELEIKAEDQKMRVGRLPIKITCKPYIFAPERTVKTGYKPAGVIAADVTIEDVGGDVPTPAKIEITNNGTVAQQMVLCGLQWQDAVAGNDLLLQPSTFDYSTAPLNGSYTAGTDEVQAITPTGTVSGGTWAWGWGSYAIAAIDFDATPAETEDLIEAVVGVGNITVGGSALSAGAMTFTFTGDFATANVAELTVDDANITGGGTLAASTTTPGVAGYVANTSLQSEWSSFVRTAAQTDVGSYQLWALVQTSADANECLIRATISIGDAASGTTNKLAAVPASAVPILVPLGPVHVNPRTSGTHRWQATIAAKTLGTAGTYCRVLGVLKGATEHGRIIVKTEDGGDSSLSMLDNFGATSGALTGDTATTGQTWAAMGALDDADDFTETAAPDNAVIRTATLDTSTDIRYGRGVVLGSATPTDVKVSVSKSDARLSGVTWGVIARFTDNDNFVAGTHDGGTIYVRKVVAGTVTTLGTYTLTIYNSLATLTLTVLASGRWVVAIDGTDYLSGIDTALATGGALASGKSGFLDHYVPAGAETRVYSNFSVSIPPPADAAIHPSQDAAWQYNGSFEREASGGTYWAYASGQQGAGVPMLGPGDNRLLIATADQNPDYAATGNQSAPFTYTVKCRPASAIGRHGL